MKKPNRRSKVKNPSLKKQYNSRIRQEYIDLDYLDKLDDTKKTCKLPDGSMVTELEYMALFMKEWNSGSVPKQKEASKGKLHRSKKQIKACTDRTNSRNRDQYGIAKAQNRVHKLEQNLLNDYMEKKRTISTNYTEDTMIDLLDHAKELGDSGSDTDK